MNFTILNLVYAASTTMSPLLMYHQLSSSHRFSLFQSKFVMFSSHALQMYISQSAAYSKGSIEVNGCTFSKFLNSPLSFESVQNKYENQIYRTTSLTIPADTTTLLITKCTFEECTTTGTGGAIRITVASSVTLASSVFDGCKASDNGGAVYFQASPVPLFQSQYCCYSKCTAGGGKEGSAIKGFASRIELTFSGTNMCPDPTAGVVVNGAQVDITSTHIESANMNFSGGQSTWCGACEYRSTSTGFFKHQTIVNTIGHFIISLTGTGSALDVTRSNIVGCTVRGEGSGSGPRPSILYAGTDGNGVYDGFCIFGCTLGAGQGSLNGVDMKAAVVGVQTRGGAETGGTIACKNLVTNFALEDITGGSTSTNVIVDHSSNQYGVSSTNTHNLEQLSLGDCAGAQIAPGYEETTNIVTSPPQQQTSSSQQQPSTETVSQGASNSIGGNTSPTSPPNPNLEKKTGLSKEEKIAAIATPISLLFLIIIIVIVVLMMLAKKKKKVANENEGEEEDEKDLDDKFIVSSNDE